MIVCCGRRRLAYLPHPHRDVTGPKRARASGGDIFEKMKERRASGAPFFSAQGLFLETIEGFEGLPRAEIIGIDPLEQLQYR